LIERAPSCPQQKAQEWCRATALFLNRSGGWRRPSSDRRSNIMFVRPGSMNGNRGIAGVCGPNAFDTLTSKLRFSRRQTNRTIYADVAAHGERHKSNHRVHGEPVSNSDRDVPSSGDAED